MYTEFGTSYNSYVQKSGQTTILFETAKAKFKEEWMDKIKEVGGGVYKKRAIH